MAARIVPALFALLLCLALAPAALAGGFAVTTLDGVPAKVRAGETVRLGYTVRQHGVQPVADATTSIKAEGPDGQKLAFPARAEGQPGHYVAELRFPATGSWLWEVDQSPFPPQPLGVLAVDPALTPTLPRVAEPSPSLALVLLRVVLPAAALAACALFALRLSALMRAALAGVTAGGLGRARVGE